MKGYNELPPKASLLYGIETPSAGGETFFYNLYEAYVTLPESPRTCVQELSCEHDATRNSSGQLCKGFWEYYSNSERPGAIHPLVVGTQRQVGRRSI
jgi:taurine dioxygenase